MDPAPFETALAHQCATATHWKDAGSDYNSLPNYIALTTGIPTGDSRLDPFSCDCASASSVNVTVDNLFRQVRTAGLTEKSYAEGMSGNCSNTGTAYAPKHNPALYMWGGSDRQACRADDVPMGSSSSGAFIDSLQAGTLPNFSFIAPNLCHDTHDCGVAAGDAYLKTLMGNILASRLYGQGHTAVAVVWDEDTPVPNIVVSPSSPPGNSGRVDGQPLLPAPGNRGHLRPTASAVCGRRSRPQGRYWALAHRDRGSSVPTWRQRSSRLIATHCPEGRKRRAAPGASPGGPCRLRR